MHKQSSYDSSNTTERERLAVGLARLHIQYTQRYPCTPHANKYEHAHSLSESRKEKGESQNNGRDASKLALPSMNMNQPMALLSFLLAWPKA